MRARSVISKPYPRKGTETPPKRTATDYSVVISKPYPRKGTETVNNDPQELFHWSISKPYPRKGTETDHAHTPQPKRCQFQNHIPARGRKLYWKATINVLRNISKPYPRKGTEIRNSGGTNKKLFNFKTISPQGDGNRHHQTPYQQAQDHFKTISPQGDGNIVITCHDKSLLPYISKPYPRKGTETTFGT